MEDPNKKIDIDKILKQNPDATVGDFKIAGDGLQYQPKEKEKVKNSSEKDTETIRIIKNLKMDLEKELQERKKLLGMTFETSPGMTDMRDSLINIKIEKIDNLKQVIKEFEKSKDYKEKKDRSDEDTILSKLGTELSVIKILEKAKAVDLPDGIQKIKFEKMISILEESILDYYDHKKQKEKLVKIFNDGKLLLDKESNPKIEVNGKKMALDEILKSIREIEEKMLIEQENKLNAIIELRLALDDENEQENAN